VFVTALSVSTTGEGWASGLVRQCASGDERAWTRLYLQHQEQARRFLFRLGVPADSLDDACQEVFLEVFRYLPKFRGESSFTTWLYRLCVSQARRVRTRGRVQRTVKELLGRLPAAEVPPGDFAEATMHRRVEAALNALTEKQRVVFVMFELEGETGKAIAEVLECPEATVWRRLHDARKTFRASLKLEAGKS